MEDLLGQFDRAFHLRSTAGENDPRRNQILVAATPQFGLIAGSALASALVFTNFNEALVRVFTFSILLSTAATLVPYVVCTLALLSPSLRRQRAAGSSLVAITVFALVYSLWALWGTGRESLLWGAVLFAVGVPVYLLSRRKV